MTNDPKKLNIGRSLLPFGIFVLLLLILFSVFSSLSDKRRETVTKPYVQETERYIETNRDGLTKLFTEVFPNEPCVTYNYEPSVQCKKPTQEEIMKRISPNLKDFSSTMFLKRGGSTNLLIMRISGDTENASVYPPEKEQQIIKLLEGHTAEVPWDDYFYQFNGKEIVVPVNDSSGKVIGAIVRGIIE